MKYPNKPVVSAINVFESLRLPKDRLEELIKSAHERLMEFRELANPVIVRYNDMCDLRTELLGRLTARFRFYNPWTWYVYYCYKSTIDNYVIIAIKNEQLYLSTADKAASDAAAGLSLLLTAQVQAGDDRVSITQKGYELLLTWQSNEAGKREIAEVSLQVEETYKRLEGVRASMDKAIGKPVKPEGHYEQHL